MCLLKAAEPYQLMAYIKEIQIEKKTHLLSVVSSNGTINEAFIVAKTSATNYHPAFQGCLYTAWFPIFIDLDLAQASKAFALLLGFFPLYGLPSIQVQFFSKTKCMFLTCIYVQLKHIFLSVLAIKTKIKTVKKEGADRKIILQKKKKIVKLGNFNKNDLKKVVLILKNGADCPCQQLDNLGTNFLIMGRKVGKQYLLTSIHKWDKSGTFRKALKKLKNHKCPAYEGVF